MTRFLLTIAIVIRKLDHELDLFDNRHPMSCLLFCIIKFFVRYLRYLILDFTWALCQLWNCQFCSRSSANGIRNTMENLEDPNKKSTTAQQKWNGPWSGNWELCAMSFTVPAICRDLKKLRNGCISCSTPTIKTIIMMESILKTTWSCW